MYIHTLRELRQIAGLSAKYVAEKLGVSEGTVFHYEQGTRSIGVETIVELARLYGCHIEEIVLAGIRALDERGCKI